MAAANTSEAFEGALTVIFAFLATAYSVGRRLTRFQATLVSAFFLLGASGSLFMALVEFRRAAMFMAQLTSEFGVESISRNVYIIPLFTLVAGLLVLAAVFFLFRLRRGGGTGTHREAGEPG